MRASIIAAWAVLFVACSSDSTELDAGGRDAQASEDARPREDARADATALDEDATAPDEDATEPDEDATAPDEDAAMQPEDAEPSLDALPVDADTTDSGPACIPDSPCTTNPSAPCRLGKTTCTSTSSTCADGDPVADGTACAAGLCSLGACLAPLTAVGAELDLSTTPISPGRVCAEAPQYSIVALTATAATLTSSPTADCLAIGDEVLLINLQGAPGASANIGAWELLEIEAINGTGVTFTTMKTRSYGDARGSDNAVGVGAGEQKVAMIRVPRFGALTIPSGTTITSARWDGMIGGVVALRAASLDLDGTISASELGYRGGRWSRDNSDCSDNVTTESGESIEGAGSATTMRNIGGSGGIDAFTGSSFNDNTPLSPTAGHALPGEAGLNAGPRTLGEPGEAYGIGDGTRLTMGSGPGGNLTCAFGPGPVLQLTSAPASGIVLLLTARLHVGATGAISATPPDVGRDIAPSGGYVWIHGGDLDLGVSRVTARGAIGHGGSSGTTGLMNAAGPGYIVVESSGMVTGSSEPPANVIPF